MIAIFVANKTEEMDIKKKRIEIGLMFKLKRVELGLTQQQLAVEASTDANWVGKIEKGQVNVGLDLLIRICNALKIKSIDL